MENILTDEDFEKKINTVESGAPSEPYPLVLVDFFATWCQPCTILAPILEKIAKDFTEKIVFTKADVDNIPLAAQKFGVEKIPTVILFKNGKPISSFVGLVPESSIKEWLKNIIEKNDNTDKNESPTPADHKEGDKQKNIEELSKEYAEYAKNNGFQLNPDKKTVERVINGLLGNEKKYGKKYCPCRRVSGDETEDSKKICPCFWHKDEIKKDGHCFCQLYTK